MRKIAADPEYCGEGKRKKGSVPKKILGIVGKILAVLLGALAVLICRSVIWVLHTWNNLTMEEIVFHLKMPMEGTNSGMIEDYLLYSVVPAVLTAAALVLIFLFVRRRTKPRRTFLTAVPVAAVLIIAASVAHIWSTLDVSAYVENQNTYSSFIDDHYVDPAETDITFPEQKRNLIYIYLESMENTYADQESGGAFEKNVIPELTQLSLENENFSGGHSALNGGYSLTGTTWTVGAMFGQTSGLPLLLSVDKNSMNTQENFFPGITTLGDILEDAGYRQELVIGSDASFGGRKLYFQQHGNYEIYDYNYSRTHGEIPEDYRVWWGYEDEKLFENANQRLNELAESDQPFNLTMLTVDTHFENGYVCSLCSDEFGDDQYSNVMACSSRQVAEFVSWIQEQPFYENTTIVISGDHPTMDVDYCENVAEDYVRKVYTVYINAPVTPATNAYREYSTFDAFPTTLASLGCTIEGDRLGLGTNLFSKEETLVEQYGIDAANAGLSQKSVLMDQLNSSIKKANVSSINYERESQQLTFTVDDIQWDQAVTGVSCEVWTDEEKQDLRVYNGTVGQDGKYYLQIPVSDFHCKSGTYSICTYLKLEDASNVSIKNDSIEVNLEAGLSTSSDGKSATVVSAAPYDFQAGKLFVRISNLPEDSNIESICCAVWAKADQSDLRWYEASEDGPNEYLAEISGGDFNYKHAKYNVHVYAEDSAGIQTLLGACRAEMN